MNRCMPLKPPRAGGHLSILVVVGLRYYQAEPFNCPSNLLSHCSFTLDRAGTCFKRQTLASLGLVLWAELFIPLLHYDLRLLTQPLWTAVLAQGIERHIIYPKQGWVRLALGLCFYRGVCYVMRGEDEEGSSGLLLLEWGRWRGPRVLRMGKGAGGAEPLGAL